VHRALARVALACALSFALRSQVVEVANTGCPGAGYPQRSAAARLGLPFQWSWPCRPPPVAWTVFGFASGNRLPLWPPIACVPGPCLLYVAPIVAIVESGPIGSWSLVIPNDRALLATTWAIQTGCLTSVPAPCLHVSGAVALAIQP
jgi:hypothetical protein